MGPPLRRDDTPRATGHKPFAALFRFPGRGRLVRPRSGVHAVSNAEPGIMINDQLRATSYELQAILSPSPRTTHHVPRTNRVDTRVRPYVEKNEPQPQATSRCLVIPIERATGSREEVHTGAISVARGRHKKQMVTTQSPNVTSETAEPGLRRGDEGRCTWLREGRG